MRWSALPYQARFHWSQTSEDSDSSSNSICPNSISIQTMNINVLILTAIECYGNTTFLEGATYNPYVFLS
ncbi:hypothetical protein L211DRAFT_351081 [Terfezia boudieri ATCC MYA-4762]|uniref:Uncharacterized protein n=1 Tax=Terfezia boudieri ATCC MYA-4762 TaxID=1051890 RepID=A0A3N4LL89_9PEZI|nr:hypothetical protein L211DRAFT_351081 [Terfezia boudieri ATCC MYA-4762]